MYLGSSTKCSARRPKSFPGPSILDSLTADPLRGGGRQLPAFHLLPLPGTMRSPNGSPCPPCPRPWPPHPRRSRDTRCASRDLFQWLHAQQSTHPTEPSPRASRWRRHRGVVLPPAREWLPLRTQELGPARQDPRPRIPVRPQSHRNPLPHEQQAPAQATHTGQRGGSSGRLMTVMPRFRPHPLLWWGLWS